MKSCINQEPLAMRRNNYSVDRMGDMFLLSS